MAFRPPPLSRRRQCRHRRGGTPGARRVGLPARWRDSWPRRNLISRSASPDWAPSGWRWRAPSTRGACPASALSQRRTRSGQERARRPPAFRSPPRLVGLAEPAEAADVIVECLPSAQFGAIAEPAVERGRIFMPLSVGAAHRSHAARRAARAQTGARIIVPTGALLGLDAVRATAEGEIASARIVTRKPPAGLAGAPLLAQRGISVDGLKEPLRVFDGSARRRSPASPPTSTWPSPCRLPASAPIKTRVEVWADPGVTRNTHTVIVEVRSLGPHHDHREHPLRGEPAHRHASRR